MAPPDGGFAQGALVGAIGPGGNLDVSERDVRDDGGFLGVAFALSAVAHGAAVPVAGVVVAFAQGALVPDSAAGPGGAWGRACVVWAWGCWFWGGMAFGSGSKLNNEPKGKCCTTGNLERTSALYILSMP